MGLFNRKFAYEAECAQFPFFFFILFFLLGFYFHWMRSATPEEYVKFGKEKIIKKKKAEAQKAFWTAFLLRNAHYIGELNPSSNVFLRLVPQTGNLLAIAYYKDKIGLKYYNIDHISKYINPVVFPVIVERDLKVFYQSSANIFSSIIKENIMNAEIGPRGHIAFYQSGKKKNHLALMIFQPEPSFVSILQQSKQQKPEQNSNRAHSFAYKKIVLHQSTLISTFNNIFFVTEPNGDAWVCWYEGGDIYSQPLNEKSKKLVKNIWIRSTQISVPFQKIGGFLSAYPTASWNLWGFLVGGGGSYNLHILEMNKEKTAQEKSRISFQKILSLSAISSKKIHYDADFRYIIFWRGGAGRRYRFLYDRETKKVKPVLSLNEVIPKEICPNREKNNERQIEQILSTGKVIISCQDKQFIGDLANLYDKKKEKTWTALRTLGQKLVLDVARNRFFMLMDNKIYVLPLSILISPDSFNKELMGLLNPN